MEINLVPITFKICCEFIAQFHRHHAPPVGHKFSIGIEDKNKKLRGVCCVGRPVARGLDDGYTAEITRVCTDGVKNGCSMLYGAAARTAMGMGYKRIITYILENENGTSLLASNYKFDGIIIGRAWGCPSRIRLDTHPLGNKKRFVYPDPGNLF
jgi:hypothetical protein